MTHAYRTVEPTQSQMQILFQVQSSKCEQVCKACLRCCRYHHSAYQTLSQFPTETGLPHHCEQSVWWKVRFLLLLAGASSSSTAFFIDFIAFILVHFSVAKCYRRLADLQSSEKPQSDQSTPNCQKGSQKCKNGNFIDLMQWSVGKPLTLVQAAHGKLQISERCNRRAPSEQPNCTSAKLSIAQVHRIIAHGCWLQPVCRSCRHTH